MFDPALIPPEIWPPIKVAELNAMLARLEARKIDRIVMPEAGSGFRGSNTIRTYCQAYLRRCLVLIGSAYDLFFIENGLVSMMCLRAIYETVASFLDFEKKLQVLIAQGDLQAIVDFSKRRTHFTKDQHLIDTIGEQIKATNVLTQVEKMAKLRCNIMKEYDFLSEHTHPNSFGTVLYFADLKTEYAADTVTFSDGGPDPRADLQWILVAADLLRYFEQALDRVEAVLPALSVQGAAASPNKPPTP
jgi:hypothetical protein